jgi:hypothetical protein
MIIVVKDQQSRVTRGKRQRFLYNSSLLSVFKKIYEHARAAMTVLGKWLVVVFLVLFKPQYVPALIT